MTLGNNGIINKAQGAVDAYKNAQEKEEYELAKAANEIDEYATFTRAGENSINYSLSEQDTGIKWINGETIWQKTVDCGTLSKNSTKQIAHNINNLDKVIEVTGVIQNSTSMRPLPYVNDKYKTSDVSIELSNTYITILNRDEDRSDYTAFITIKYTKKSN